MEILSSTEEILKKAKLGLLLGNPFFASMLFKLEFKWDDTIPTACTNGIDLKVNPSFFESLTQDTRMGLLAHEVCHPMLFHHTRRKERDPRIWNMACDYAINLILKDSGIILPEDALLDHKYAGMAAETIYDLIKDDSQQDNGQGGGGFGEVEDFPGDAEEKQAEEYKQAESALAAAELAKLAGKGSSLIDQIIKELITPVVAWYDELRQIMTEKSRDDYTWKKPNKRYMGTGFYLPSLENETFGLIGLFWDTSGSTRRLQDRFAGEMDSIKREVNAPMMVAYFDTKVVKYEMFEPQDDLEIKPVGGGGTDFRAPFNWAERNDFEPRIAIVFTDGECYSYPDEPDYEVIWAVCDNKSFSPPFGRVIHVE